MRVNGLSSSVMRNCTLLFTIFIQSELTIADSNVYRSFDVGFRIGAKITDHGISIESQIIDATNFVHAVEGVPPMRELYELEERMYVSSILINTH